MISLIKDFVSSNYLIYVSMLKRLFSDTVRSMAMSVNAKRGSNLPLMFVALFKGDWAKYFYNEKERDVHQNQVGNYPH